MSHLTDPMSLKPHEWEELRGLADRLEQAWRGGEGPDLAALLESVGPPRRLPFLHELIKTDLEMRHRHRRPLLLERYAERFPELGPAASLPVELILEEYRVRQRYGDQPALASYRVRFPARFEQLQQQVLQQPAGTLPLLDGRGPTPTLPSAPADPPPAVEHEVLPVGDSYRLVRAIGRGEYGEVYRALAPGGVEVAVKRIFRPSDHAASQREWEALELIKSLGHPFLLQTQAYWTEGGRLHIVMELADDSLHDRYQQCRAQGLPGVPRDELLAYFEEAAVALDFLHGRKVIHRDIKPANLLRLQGHAKVGDFGLARLFEGGEAATYCGTLAYMPPEVFGGRLSPHSDQYSLVATFIEMCAGQRVATAGNPRGVPVADLQGFTPAERKVLQKGLAADPDQRYPTCRAFVRALRDASAPPARTSVLWNRAVPAALVAVLLGVVAWQVFRAVKPRTPPPPPAWLPEGFQVKEAGDDPNLPKALVFTGPEGVEVEFLLVPRGKPGDPPSFYVSKDKVTNEQFRAALTDPRLRALLAEWREKWAEPKAVRDRWDLPAGPKDARRPVMEVTAVEAHCFARWLGGDLGGLPSGAQWDKAGGRFDDAEGPFRHGWEGPPAREDREAPTPVGHYEEDVSKFGCRGMAVNGREWTTDVSLHPQQRFPAVAQGKVRLVLRGGSFEDGELFRFAVLKSAVAPEALPYSESRRDVGFRVVLEPPAGP